MARTFDIRFARSDGIAAILESPANTFRLRGTGSLSIDDAGLEIRPRRGLFSLFSRSVRVRIDAAHLREVRREGESLRIEYGTPGSRRIVMPFWVSDRDTAIEIMKLVPTRRTIELEESVARPQRRRLAPLVVGALLIVFAAAGIGWLVRSDAPGADASASPATADMAAVGNEPSRPFDATPVAATPTPKPTPTTASRIEPAAFVATRNVAPAAADPPRYDQYGNAVVGDEAPAPAAPRDKPADLAGATPSDAAIRVVAQQQYDAFQEHAANFYGQYLNGSATPTELATQWADFSRRLVDSPEYRDARLRPLLDEELAAAAGWRGALLGIDAANRSGDRAALARANEELQRASALTARIAAPAAP